MNLSYLLDTNVLSEPLRPEPSSEILRRLQEHEGRVATCAPVWHELVFGYSRLERGRRRQAIQEYIEEVVRPNLIVLPYDDRAAEWHGRERARLESIGRTPPLVDGQIAAIAAVNDLVLVTSNVNDFEPFQGLEIKDWRSG